MHLSRPLPLTPTQTLKNRLAKSAMSENFAPKDGAPTALHARLYGAWSDGGAGLVITGNVMIDGTARNEPGNVVIEDDRHLPALKAWAAAGTRHDTKLWMQLCHPGKQAPRGLNPENVAPSAIPFRADLRRFFPTPRALTEAEIHASVARFAATARIAQQAGFSGVQVHGAHGYLVSQFLSPHHNQRTDAWGGSPEHRRRFVLAILAAIRAATGPDFPIGIKLNSADFQRGGFSEEESLDVIGALTEAGIDMIEISGGTYEAPAMTGIARESTRLREAYFLEFAEKARAATNKPLMLTGGFRTAAGMNAALDSGAVDLIGLARVLAMEPDLPRRLLAGEPARHTVAPIRTGIGAIDSTGMLEVSWYTRQLRRIAKGRAPNPTESATKVFALGLLSQTATLLRGRPAIRKLRA